MTFGLGLAPIVIDASAAIEFLGGDPGWISAFDSWAIEERLLLAPAQFLAEVANTQLVGQHVPAADVARRIERLVAAGVDSVDRGLGGLLEAIALADSHGLTVYDALYLQLALDVEGELATLDQDLRRAATAEDVPLV